MDGERAEEKKVREGERRGGWRVLGKGSEGSIDLLTKFTICLLQLCLDAALSGTLEPSHLPIKWEGLWVWSVEGQTPPPTPSLLHLSHIQVLYIVPSEMHHRSNGQLTILVCCGMEH